MERTCTYLGSWRQMRICVANEEDWFSLREPSLLSGIAARSLPNTLCWRWCWSTRAVSRYSLPPVGRLLGAVASDGFGHGDASATG